VSEAVRTSSGSHAVAKLPPGVQLGDYVLGQPLWPLRIADAYRATGPVGACTIYIIHPQIAAHPQVRDHVIAGTRAAAALPEHKHLVRTIAAGLTGDVLWIATEEVDGSSVRDLLIKKRQQGAAGFGTRGTANLLAGVAAALAEVHHGAFGTESVVVNRTGRVRVVDLALGPGTAAAMFAGLIPPHSSMAPELLSGGPASGPGDVYAIGALLYEALVGKPLERGGPRPSEVVEGTNSQIDEIVARACHRDPEKRFGRVDVLGEVVAEALAGGGAMMTHAVPLLERSEVLEQQVKGLGPDAGVSLASQIAASPSPAASGSNIDRVLATALADSTEKWLLQKGRLDYGPFSLADVVERIDKGDIVAGNFIMDKDTGARYDIGEHPLLGPMVEQSRARRDEQRRAQAEVKAQSRDKKRGVVLYSMILLGLAAVGVGVYFLVADVIIKSDDKKIEVSELEGASLQVKVSEPKAPPRKHTGGGGGRRTSGGGGGGGPANASENLALDMSDENDETQTLDMGTVFRVYSKAGGRLGGCLQRTGEGSANIGIIIDGPSGRINWVKVNGKQAGALYGCLSGVLRSLQFPSIHGPRTRAEFDIGL
jgi:eukaryotic-like serine/threonine-protein kinase